MLATEAKRVAKPASAQADEPDEALMTRLMGGDSGAFERLFERYGNRMRAFVQRFVGRADIADDLTQEIFLKIYRNPRAFDPRGRFVTWLFAVARNACIDWLRLKRLPTVPLTADGDEERAPEPPAKSASPDDRALGHELDSRFEQAVLALSPKLREAFLLCGIQGLPYEDAALIIECPVKTVSSRLSRARDQLFQALRRHMGEAIPNARKGEST